LKDHNDISLSISVVCYNSSEKELRVLISSTLNAITALKRCINTLPIPIFLIDNSESENLSLERFADLQQQAIELGVELTLLYGHGNIGYGAAHNLVIKELNSDYHLLLNPDLDLGAESLISGITYMQQNDEVVMAGPSAEYENGEKQYLCKQYPSVFTFLVRGFFPMPVKKLFHKRLAKFEMHKLSDSEASVGIPIISGCFMLCRSEELKKVQGFDESYFLYFEDFDLSLRMAALGKIAYVPAMRITHTGGNTARKGWGHIKMFARSGIRFFNTHGWHFFSQAG
jgi:GT2 family glycosyltransferase